jgi:polyisoprenoid-binding protein YceI
MTSYLKGFVASTLLAAGLSATPAKATTYDIDIVHSHVAFFIGHLGFSKVIGVVNDFSGSFDFDQAHPEASKLDVALKVASIFTNSKQRDSDIQGADWFNATEFPEITFAGTKFEKTGEKTGKITGNLMIAGITKPVTLDVVFNGEGQNPWDKSHEAGFSARTALNRSDFGLKTGLPMIGDQVELYVEIEGRGRQ